MSRWIVHAIGFVTASFVAGAPTRADIVYFYAEGVVTRVRDPEGLLPPNIVPGSTFWAEYSVQTLTPDQDFLDPVQGFYPNAMWDLYGEVAGHDFELYDLGGDIRIENPLANSGGERYRASARTAFQGFALDFNLFLGSSSSDVFADDRLPGATFPIEPFSFRELRLSDTSEILPIAIEASLTWLVPEPSVGCLLAFLLLSCSRWHRMR